MNAQGVIEELRCWHPEQTVTRSSSAASLIEAKSCLESSVALGKMHLGVNA